jgi:undecaprenyl-diphosphatase
MTADHRASTRAIAAPDRSSERERASEGSGAAWLVLALLGLGGFALLTVAVASKVVLPFDQPMLDLARQWQAWAPLWRVISESANIPLVVIGFAIVIWLFVTKRRREALLVLLLLAAITAGSEGVKQLVARPRPEGTDPNIPGVVYSYPSGHVLEALVIFGIITIRSWRSSWPLPARVAIAVLVAIEVLLVGLARVALNAHYPSDVLAGLLGGFGVLGLYTWLTRPGGWAYRPGDT